MNQESKIQENDKKKYTPTRHHPATGETDDANDCCKMIYKTTLSDSSFVPFLSNNKPDLKLIPFILIMGLFVFMLLLLLLFLLLLFFFFFVVFVSSFCLCFFKLIFLDPTLLSYVLGSFLEFPVKNNSFTHTDYMFVPFVISCFL